MSPIRPENRHHYTAAAGWPEVRRQVLLWDQNRCAFCGLSNGEVIDRNRQPWLVGPPRDVSWLKHEPKWVKIVLTVAHLDGSTDHSDPGNLRALCQACHLKHDGKQHADNARATRAAKRRNADQQSIEGIAP